MCCVVESDSGRTVPWQKVSTTHASVVEGSTTLSNRGGTFCRSWNVIYGVTSDYWVPIQGSRYYAHVLVRVSSLIRVC